MTNLLAHTANSLVVGKLIAASELTKANDYERHPIAQTYELLTVLSRENWLAARIIDTPCEDMTRAWYSISSEIEQEKLDELAKLESKHSIQQELTNLIRWARLYGGALAVMILIIRKTNNHNN